jgi:DNA polymerase-3 subunit beta
MKIEIERERLLRPLSQVISVVEKRQTLPILGNVYLRYEADALTLIGTDLETEIITKVAGVKGDGGETTVMARKIYDICRSLPDDASLIIKGQGERTTIKSGKSRFTLQSLPATDFPRLEAEEWDVEIEVEQKELKGLLERTAFSMGQQDVRYYLNGCLLELNGTVLRAVATDGHRLAKSEIEQDEDIAKARQAIVPRKAIMEMTRFMEGDTTAVVAFSNNHLRVKTGNVMFTSKLIDGRFPDYEKVIPSSLSTHLLVDRIGFYDILARAAILTNEKFRGVRLKLQQGSMQVSAHNPEQEEATDEMAVVYEGPELEIGFNVGYLMDALRAINTEQVDLGVQDANSSCTLNAPEEKQTLYLVMPMRL